MSLPRFEKEWDGFKGHVAVKWDKIPNEELLRVEGHFGNLVKIISDKYGENKSVVEAKLNELYHGYLDTRDRLAEGLSDMRENIDTHSHEVAASIRERAGQYQEKAKERMHKIREENIDPAVQKSEEYIKVHPFSSVLGALGIGILLGGAVGLLTSRKN
jgi:ElaB/YqjD/DUF883 family membrane-anchored ribosome-binding protein